MAVRRTDRIQRTLRNLVLSRDTAFNLKTDDIIGLATFFISVGITIAQVRKSADDIKEIQTDVSVIRTTISDIKTTGEVNAAHWKDISHRVSELEKRVYPIKHK